MTHCYYLGNLNRILMAKLGAPDSPDRFKITRRIYGKSHGNPAAE
jgi:hypothetical protein